MKLSQSPFLTNTNKTLRINVCKWGLILILSVLVSCASLQQKKVTYHTADAGLQTVHTLDVYAEANVIHVLLSGVEQASQQLVVRYISSQDAGETWSTAITVNKEKALIKQSKRGNDFQVAAYGNKVMAIWRTQGGEPWVGIIASALSSDNGKTWQILKSPVSEKHSKIDQGYFDLTADPEGQFHISWLDDREEAGNTQVLRYARYSEKDAIWIQHKVLENSACTCCWSSITTDEKSNIHILYRDDNPRDMLTISSLDKGKSWQKSKVIWPFNWEFVGCPHQGGGLITTHNDNEVILHSIIWNGVEESRGLYYSQAGLSGDKTVPLEFLDNEWSDSGDIAALDNDNIAVVYTTREEDQKIVRAKFSEDGGKSWSTAKQLTREGAEPSHPRIVSSSEGFRFFWTEWQENGDAIVIMSTLK